MYKTILPNNNVIYHFKSLDILQPRINFNDAKNCSVFLAPDINLMLSTIDVRGDNAAIFLGNSEFGRVSLFVCRDSCVYIGNNNYFNPYGEGRQHIRVVSANLIIGNDCLISTPLELSTTDAHLIYNKENNTRLNKEKSIFIGDHVWIGRDVKIFKGSSLSSGSICGAGSLLSSSFCPHNSIIAGIPGKIARANNVFYLSSTTYHFTEEQMIKYDKVSSDDSDVQMACFKIDKYDELPRNNLDLTLRSLKSSGERISFMYDKLYLSQTKNRFTWQEEAIDPCIIQYKSTSLKEVYPLVINNFRSNASLRIKLLLYQILSLAFFLKKRTKIRLRYKKNFIRKILKTQE